MNCARLLFHALVVTAILCIFSCNSGSYEKAKDYYLQGDFEQAYYFSKFLRESDTKSDPYHLFKELDFLNHIITIKYPFKKKINLYKAFFLFFPDSKMQTYVLSNLKRYIEENPVQKKRRGLFEQIDIEYLENLESLVSFLSPEEYKTKYSIDHRKSYLDSLKTKYILAHDDQKYYGYMAGNKIIPGQFQLMWKEVFPPEMQADLIEFLKIKHQQYAFALDKELGNKRILTNYFVNKMVEDEGQSLFKKYINTRQTEKIYLFYKTYDLLYMMESVYDKLAFEHKRKITHKAIEQMKPDQNNPMIPKTAISARIMNGEIRLARLNSSKNNPLKEKITNSFHEIGYILKMEETFQDVGKCDYISSHYVNGEYRGGGPTKIPKKQPIIIATLIDLSSQEILGTKKVIGSIPACPYEISATAGQNIVKGNFEKQSPVVWKWISKLIQ